MNSDRASVVDRARPRITKEVGQTLRKPALQFHAQRVVVRLAAAINLLEPAKLRIGSPRGYRPGCRWNRVVEGSEDLEFTAHRADVAHLQVRVSSTLALYVKHVLDGIGVPGDAEARRKIIFIVGYKPVAEPAVARDLHRRLEPDRQTLVEVAPALPHQGWVAAHIRYIRSHVDERNMKVDQVPGLVQKWRRVLVPQPEVDRHLRVDLPCIVDVVGLARRPELDLGGHHRPLVALAVAKQVLRKRVARAGHCGARWAQLRPDLRFETELAA